MEQLLQQIEQQQKEVNRYAATLALPRRICLAVESAIDTGMMLPETKAAFTPNRFEADTDIPGELTWGLSGVIGDIASSGYRAQLVLNSSTSEIKIELSLGDKDGREGSALKVSAQIKKQSPEQLEYLQAEDMLGKIDLDLHNAPVSQAVQTLEKELEKVFWNPGQL